MDLWVECLYSVYTVIHDLLSQVVMEIRDIFQFSFRKVYLEYLCSDQRKYIYLESLGKAQEVDFSVT